MPFNFAKMKKAQKDNPHQRYKIKTQIVSIKLTALRVYGSGPFITASRKEKKKNHNIIWAPVKTADMFTALDCAAAACLDTHTHTFIRRLNDLHQTARKPSVWI